MTASASQLRQSHPSRERQDAEDAPRCAVCDHQLVEHDPIALRYCQATQAQALPRNCICR